MNKFNLILFCLITMLVGDYFAYAQVSDFVLAKRAGGSTSLGGAAFRDSAEDVAIDASGNIIVVGSFNGIADFDGTTVTAIGNDQHGPTDIFVAKYDPTGNLIWIRHTGGSPNQAASNLALGITTDASSNIIVTGFYTGSITFDTITLPSGGANDDMFLVKYDSNGSVVWAKAATGSFAVKGWGVATDGVGNVIVNGGFGHHNFGGTATFGTTTLTSAGGVDIFIAKYDSNGNLLWVRQAGSSNTNSGELGFGVTVDGTGNSIATGRFKGTAIFGSTTLTSSGNFDIFVAKYDPNGSLLWARRAGGSGPDEGQNIALDAVGNIIVTGGFQNVADFQSTILTSAGNYDAFIAKYDPNGTLVWADRAGGPGFDFGIDVAVNSSGESFTTGAFGSTADFGTTLLNSLGGSDIFVSKYDVNGNSLWAIRAGSNDVAFGDNGRGITFDNAGNSVVIGFFGGISDFGNTTLTSVGGQDIFIAKVGPSNQPPDCSLAAIADQSAGTNCGATISGADVTSVTDPDGDPLTITVDPMTLVLGANTVTVSADDGNGGTCSTDITVNVLDDTSPTIVCPSNITVDEDTPGLGNAIVNFNVTANDNCSVSVVSTPASGSSFAVGTTTVNNTATDGSGNQVNCSFTVTVNPLPIPEHNFVLLADDWVKIRRHNLSKGDIHANNSIMFSGFPNPPKGIHTGDLTAVGNITIGTRNKIKGDATAGGTVTPHGNANVTGTVTSGASITPIPLPNLSFSAGGSDVTVNPWQIKTIAPGSYNNLLVKRGGRIKLSTGEYFFNKFETRYLSDIVINVSGGPVTINVVNKLNIGNDSWVFLPPNGYAGSDQVTWNSLQASTLGIGPWASFVGTLNAPDAKVILKHDDFVKGSVCAKKIDVKKWTILKEHNQSTSSPLAKVVQSENHSSRLQAREEKRERERVLDTEKEIVSEPALNAIPESFALGQNHPNPFNPSTTIAFDVPEAGEVKLDIYNMRGQLIQTLHSGVIAAGQHSLVWNGTDFNGAKVASGMYLYRLEAKGFVMSKKLLLMK